MSRRRAKPPAGAAGSDGDTLDDGAGRAAPSEAEILARRDRAIQLRAAGLSYRQIAVELGVSRGTAHHDVIAALKFAAAGSEEVATVRELELERLDLLWRRWLPLALGTKADPPDEGALAGCLRISAMRSKLLGIEAPVRVEVDRPMRVVLDLSGDEVRVRSEPALGDGPGQDSEAESTEVH